MGSNFFQDQKGLVAYITLGDPTVNFTLNCCRAFFDNGVDLIEIGLPFSDPIADGPTIQASHHRALSSNEDVSITAALNIVKTLKKEYPNKKVVFMGATNLIMQYGLKPLLQNAVKVKLDGLIMPDLSIEMADEYNRLTRQYGVALIHLVSPLCTDERLKKIVLNSEGFIYLISSTGITGERDDFASNLKTMVKKIKNIKPISVAIGFGVSKPEHLELIYDMADGAIIGSHFTGIIQSHMPHQQKALDAIIQKVKTFKSLA